MRKTLVFAVFIVMAVLVPLVPYTALADSTAIAGAGASSESVAVGVGVGGDASSSVKIEDNSVTEVTNRQFANTVQPIHGPEPMQYFGPWQTPKTPWNLFPIKINKIWTKTEIDKLADGASIDKENFKIFLSLLPREKVLITNEEPKEGTGAFLIGFGVVRGKTSAINYEVIGMLAQRAMENGADLVVIKAISWQQKAKSGGWHIGFGAGAAGLIDGEKTSIQGTGGTGFGSSTITAEGMPWAQAVFYRNGIADLKEDAIRPAESEKKETELPVEQKVSPLKY